MPPWFFSHKNELRNWFLNNHDKETELIIGYYKVGTGKPSVTWSESVDEALCFGWIDGVRKSIDEHSYTIRFTKRRPTSIWSAINIAKVEELTRKGMMQPDGLAAFNKRKEHKSEIYAFENEEKVLTPAYEKQFKAKKTAWAHFKSQAPSYQKTAIHWVLSAKQETTKQRRLEILIHDSEAGRKIGPVRYGKK